MTKEPKNRRTKVFAASLVLWSFGSWSFAPAQDIVISSTAADPAARVKKSGTILEFTGSELRLRSALGTEETIPAARIIEVITRWSTTHEAGRAAPGGGRAGEGLGKGPPAKNEENPVRAV